jgi:hypothetical protein
MIMTLYKTQIAQVARCQQTIPKRNFNVGCLRQIRGQITTLLAKPITMILPLGLREETHSRNGNRLAHFYG